MRSAAHTVHILGLQKIVVPRRIVIRSGVNKSGEGYKLIIRTDNRFCSVIFYLLFGRYHGQTYSH